MLCGKRIEESKADFTKKILKRLIRVKDIIEHKGCQKSARIKKVLKNILTYTFFTTHKIYLIFLNITIKSIIFISTSSKNAINPINANNKYATFFFLSFPFPFISIFYIFLEIGRNIPTTSIFGGFQIFSP